MKALKFSIIPQKVEKSLKIRKNSISREPPVSNCAKELWPWAYEYAHLSYRVRVFISDLAPLAQILPSIDPTKTHQERDAIVMPEAQKHPTLIINLEYLSAEKWVADYHLKPSLLEQPTLKKYFFMPGFAEHRGGIIDTHIERTREDLSINRLSHLDSYLKEFNVSPIVSEHTEGNDFVPSMR
jgi:hypothetical protein